MSAPAMMAIGNSVFNGVRSLTIDEGLADWSAPAQVARALGVAFATPDYPRNVVVNFETWLRHMPDVGFVLGDLTRNIRFWNAFPRSRLAAFDNIAIASTVFSDMWERTWICAESELAALRAELGESFFGLNNRLDRLYFDFNTRFLLNPAADASADAKSSLDIVAERQPARLLVSIGGNNGLWQFGYLAEPWRGQDDPNGPFNRQDFADLETLFDKLASLPAAVRRIYVNALPLPSRIANLMPYPDTTGSTKPGPELPLSVLREQLRPKLRPAHGRSARRGERRGGESERADAGARRGLGSHPHRAGGPPV